MSELASNLYGIIYADPPWRYENGTPGREIERHYSTMTDEEICALNIPASKNAILYLWAVAPRIPAALAVMQSWGFQYKTCAVWDKVKVGMGFWFRGQHEILMVGTRGNVSPPPPCAQNFKRDSLPSRAAQFQAGYCEGQDRGLVSRRLKAGNVFPPQASRLGRVWEPSGA